ncbi:MAG: HemK/PrmC family methyltransferase [Spirochaetia bacterium]
MTSCSFLRKKKHPPTFFEWLSKTHNLFRPISTTPSLDAQLILCFALGISRTKLLAEHQDQRIANPHALLRANHLRRLRAQGYPIAYLLGFQEFFGYRFIVCPGLLIPRADSECLIEVLCTDLEKTQAYRMRDVGTGPGTLGLTLALCFPNAQVVCSDISRISQKIFEKNRQMLNVGNAQFKKEDLLSCSCDSYDIIVANLPYLTPAETQQKKSKERWKEPALALNGKGKDGLVLIKKLIQQAQGRCQAIYLEADPRQMPAIAVCLLRHEFTKISTYPDLTGQTRIIVGKY